MQPDLPQLDAGDVTVLRRESPRDSSLHQLVVDELGRADDALWLDARNNASTYTLYELAPGTARLADLRIARAFTAYQHHSIARRLVREATPTTDLVVVPCLASLYRDPDLPAERATRLLRSTLSILEALAAAVDAAVLVTVERDDGATERILATADRELEARSTAEGVAFEGDDYVTPGYWGTGFWQTTVPYWVDVCGATPAVDRPAALGDPAHPAVAGADPTVAGADLAGADTPVAPELDAAGPLDRTDTDWGAV
ncbi:MAG: hypothetical protein ABEH81_10190 [Halopenitus sp.]